MNNDHAKPEFTMPNFFHPECLLESKFMGRKCHGFQRNVSNNAHSLKHDCRRATYQVMQIAAAVDYDICR